MATGMVFLGSLDSPAATPTISVPWKENPAIMATPIMAWSPPTKGASPLVQLEKVTIFGVRMIFTIMAMPIIIKTIIAMTLTSENKNSLSPKPFTVSELMAKIMARKMALQ